MKWLSRNENGRLELAERSHLTISWHSSKEEVVHTTRSTNWGDPQFDLKEFNKSRQNLGSPVVSGYCHQQKVMFMRYRNRRRSFFLNLIIGSIISLASMIGLMVVFAKSFGELAIPAVHTFSLLLFIPLLGLGAGILGFFFTSWRE
jgi:hypothetical protein